MNSVIAPLFRTIALWFDADAQAPAHKTRAPDAVNWIRCIPFIAMHFACFAIIWVGWSPVAVVVCLALFWIRMFAITAFYHRYFSHKSFKTNRFWQFIFAVMGASAAQRGPLWWASHHRKHHKHSDDQHDLHSPVERGFWWSHVGWFTCDAAFRTDYRAVRDFGKYPELRFLNRFDMLVPFLLAVSVFFLGEWIASVWPSSGTSGAQMLVWGFFISTILLAHGTFTINSLCHTWGSKRFSTTDQSRNNFWLALLTLGEGWHNNHHRYAVSARQGFYWWEIDISYYVIKMLGSVGIVYDIKPVPSRIIEEGKGAMPHEK